MRVHDYPPFEWYPFFYFAFEWKRHAEKKERDSGSRSVRLINKKFHTAGFCD